MGEIQFLLLAFVHVCLTKKQGLHNICSKKRLLWWSAFSTLDKVLSLTFVPFS
jgi:hypothetical protein